MSRDLLDGFGFKAILLRGEYFIRSNSLRSPGAQPSELFHRGQSLFHDRSALSVKKDVLNKKYIPDNFFIDGSS